MIVFYSLISILLLILTFIYFVGIHNERYWKKRGVTFYKKNRVFGPYFEYVLGSRPLFQVIHDLCYKYRHEPAIGVGSFLTPMLIVPNPTNVDYILKKNFQSFYHKGSTVNEDDKLTNMVVMQNGQRWKILRHILTPLFTSMKLKNMYYIMDKSGKDFLEYLKTNPELHDGDFLETLKTFCAAAVSGAVFGVTSESTFKSPFLEMYRNAFNTSFIFGIKFVMSRNYPTLYKLLKLRLFKKQEKDFIGAVKYLVEMRSRDNVKRHDFGDLCISLKEKGVIVDEESGYEMKVTDDLLAAQAFVLFMASVEPTASIMFFALLELGRNPTTLDKLLKEVDETYEKYDAKFDADIIFGMEYMDKVINETLRMYSSPGYITRKCMKDAVLPVGDVPVEKGTMLLLPVNFIQNDPAVYSQPEVFDPDRPCADSDVYLPFSKGGRFCIGNRFAMLQMKTGFIHLLRHYTVRIEIDGNEIKYVKSPILFKPQNARVKIIPRNV